MPTATTYQVRDRSRLLSFTGTQLATVSSRQDPSQTRWTEMSLYVTDGGSYVLEKVGRSIVTHSPGCSAIIGSIPRFQDAHPGDDPDIGYAYHDCVPDEYDFTRLLAEEDRYWAVIAEDPRRIVEALYRRQDTMRYLPRVGIRLLEQASLADPLIADSWQVERIN